MTSEKENKHADNTQNYLRLWYVIYTSLDETRLTVQAAVGKHCYSVWRTRGDMQSRNQALPAE